MYLISYLHPDEELCLLVCLPHVPGNTRSSVAHEGNVLPWVLHGHETDVVVRLWHRLQVTELPTLTLRGQSCVDNDIILCTIVLVGMCVCVCVCVHVCACTCAHQLLLQVTHHREVASLGNSKMHARPLSIS